MNMTSHWTHSFLPLAVFVSRESVWVESSRNLVAWRTGKWSLCTLLANERNATVLQSFQQWDSCSLPPQLANGLQKQSTVRRNGSHVKPASREWNINTQEYISGHNLQMLPQHMRIVIWHGKLWPSARHVHFLTLKCNTNKFKLVS